ncbi:MAG TPA: hypothetical protein VFZ65_23110 [Planctomycetota bacterium]|nr:hypothetical protein [Planctomycetota bacterium]
MRLHPLVAALCAALPAGAQSPLAMPFGSNNGLGIGSQIYFDLHVQHGSGITVTALDVNTGTTPVGTTGTVEVYAGPASHVGNEQQPANWTLVASGAVIAAGNDQPSRACLGAGFFLAMGDHGLALRHVGVSMRYTDGNGSNQTGATAEVSLVAGASQGTPFGSSAISPRVWNGNLYYHTGAAPGLPCASKSIYGTGCYTGTTTFYEQFAGLQVFDLAGSAAAAHVLSGNRVGGAGFAVATAPSAWRTPTGPRVLSNASVPAPMGDDSMSQPLVLPFAFPFPGGATSVVHAAANGYVLLGPTSAVSSDFTPTPAELVAQQPRVCPAWMDLHPGLNLPSNAQSGIYFEVDASNQAVYVTWLDCADRRGGVPAAGATSVNVQCVLRANGNVEFRYGAMTPYAAGNGLLLVGWSRGNVGSGSAGDPGTVDLSATIPFVTAGPDSQALALDSNMPRLGGAWTFTTRNVPAIAPLAFLFVGDQQLPGIDLGLLGAPNCRSYTNANLAVGSFPVMLPAGTGTLTLAIPGTPALAGLSWTTQAVAFSLANALNLVTSNGLLGTVGS